MKHFDKSAKYLVVVVKTVAEVDLQLCDIKRHMVPDRIEEAGDTGG